MKKRLITMVLTMAFSLFVIDGFSQGPPPPPGGGHGSGGNQTGGNAPVGSGLFILLGLAAAYGGKKVGGMKNEE